MSANPFVHLHLHTAYSMLDGACRIDQIMDTAVENDMPAVAITDHGVMYGCVDFYRGARKRGLRPIIGCEVYVTSGSRHARGSEAGRSDTRHLVLLAADLAGYHNLVRLVSMAHLEGFYYKPRIDLELLSSYSKGLIGMSACLNGAVSACLLNDDLTAAIETAGRYAEILGKDSFFLEIQDHGLPDQRKVNSLMPKVAAVTQLPMVATNDVHYVRKEHAAAHEVLLCMQTQTVLTDPKRMRYGTNEFYMKSRQEMMRLFAEFPDAVDRTWEIAQRCNLDMEFGQLHFPTFQIDPGMSQKEYLQHLAWQGIRRWYGVQDPDHPRDERERGIMERFESELAIIEKTGYINYYLVVWDFVRFAREQGIPVGPGRGSGGGSLIAYVLGITALDPLRYNLIFERFLNPERVSPPDFDIDFCQARRGEVIEYVRNKYGRENVAQIITFGSLGAKSVIRDVGRVLEVPYADCDRLAKMVPDDPKMTLKTALETNPEFKRTYESDQVCSRILDYAFVLEGLFRNPGTHAAGVVIGEKPLVEIIPLARDKDKETITQYTMDPLGDIGLLKMDFLGLKTLTVMQEAADLAGQVRGTAVDLDNLPMDDKPTYDLLNRGDTVGVFQLESSGMRDLVRRINIDGIEDVIALIALYRPGPMNMLPDYVERKSGRARVRYDHDALEPILKETYGVMVYQEQVQQAANVLAGYSLGEADILRRAMGKKKKEEMEKQRAKFIDGCAKTSRIGRKLAERIFETMSKFAGYGFNKAHSAGYAIVSYQTAYLKANYPAEFMSALLSSEIGNSDKLPGLIDETVKMGLSVLPPDVNSGAARFRPEDGGVRFGLAGIKNVGEAAASEIVAERERNGPFEGLVDFCSRVSSQTANRKVIESLVRCGALDSLGLHRARLFGGIDFAMARAADRLHDRQTGQGSLFDLMDADAETTVSDELPPCEPWPESVLLAAERELLGVYMSGHPLTRHSALLECYRLNTVPELSGLEDKTLTRLGGIVSSITKRFTKASGEAMAILTLEDLEGSIEVVVYPEAFRTYGACLEQDAAVLVCGEVSFREEQVRLTAREAYPLQDAPRHFSVGIRIHVKADGLEDERLQAVRDLLRMHPGNVPVRLCLEFSSGAKVFLDTDTTFRVVPDPDLVCDLEHLLGEESVFVVANPTPCLKTPSKRGPYGRRGLKTA